MTTMLPTYFTHPLAYTSGKHSSTFFHGPQSIYMYTWLVQALPRVWIDVDLRGEAMRRRIKSYLGLRPVKLCPSEAPGSASGCKVFGKYERIGLRHENDNLGWRGRWAF
eukprot:180710-Amorphochlora_amoeboformis.AAC.2